MKKLLGTLITAAAIGLAVPASAGGITAGTFNTGNCYPYLCNDSGTNSGQSIEYQQVYSASLFPGPIVINTITGFFDQIAGGSSFVLGGSYQYFWGYAPLGSVNNLSTNLASNYLALYSLMYLGGATFPGGVFSANPTGAAPISDFIYDPSVGDLLLEIIVSNQDNVPNNSGNGYFEADSTGTVTSRAYCITGQACVADSIGLVTEFNRSATVPEPATILLLGTGLMGLRRMRRRG